MMEDPTQSPVLARIKDPLVWARLSTGYRIEDLHEKRHDDAIQLLKMHFLSEELLCKSSFLHLDDVSIGNYVDTATTWLRDASSLCAIQEGTGEIVGVLINRVVNRLERTRTFSRIRLTKNVGQAYMDVMTLRWQLHRSVDIYDLYDIDQYFRFYALCVHPKHRGKGIGMGLMKSGVLLADTLSMPAACGLFTCARSQALAFKVGMTTLSELEYMKFQRNERICFNDTGPGNYSAMMMGMRIEKGSLRPLSIYPPME